MLDVKITKKSGYSHGMAQPGLLVLKKDEEVLFQWAIDPGVVCGPPSGPCWSMFGCTCRQG